ncbi:polymorphic toxin type 23 domain-containing protein, partial [Flavobacterium pectinovorum]
RHQDSKEYRYGFQGQEKDDEIRGGDGNSLNYTFRMHDARIGRFFAMDPLTKKYPYLTPYQFSSNQPIHAKELEGCESAAEIKPYVGVSLNWGSNNKSISLTGHTTGNIGNWQGSVGGSVTLYEQFYNTGKGGFEFKASVLGGFNDGRLNVTLGTNYFRGAGGMAEFGQRTGILNFGIGKFNFSYENDGFPFQKIGLSDGHDSHRSAAVKINWGQFSGGFNLFTGYRDNYKGDEEKVSDGLNFGPTIGKFGEKMPYGYVIETGKPYRFGAAFLSYGSTKIGIESDRYIRHAIQDNWAHDMSTPNTRQPGFRSLTDDIKPFFQFKDNGDSTSPKFTLYDY